MENFLKENYLRMTNKELAEHLDCSITTIIRNLNKLNLSRRIKIEINKNEIFKDIPYYKRYMVSNLGRVMKKEDETLIQHSYTPDGYCCIKMVDDNGKRTTSRLHRIVALVFIDNDNPYEKIEVNHKDGNIINNNIENLEWVTPSENQKHAYKNKLRNSNKGDKCTFTKYTEEQVRIICGLLERGFGVTKSRKLCGFKTSEGFVSNIKRKATWKHISCEYKF